MSTRSVIARPTDLGFQGRYHHFDGYPTGLGAFLHRAYHEQFDGDLDAMLALLIDAHPAGWSTIIDADLSLEPGFLNHGHPGSYHRKYVDGAWVPNPDYIPQARCYCHGDRSEEGHLWTCSCPTGAICGGWSIEYAYVLVPQGIEVWYGAVVPGSEKDQGDDYEHVRWGLVGWDDPPDWQAIEDDIRARKDARHDDMRQTA